MILNTFEETLKWPNYSKKADTIYFESEKISASINIAGGDVLVVRGAVFDKRDPSSRHIRTFHFLKFKEKLIPLCPGNPISHPQLWYQSAQVMLTTSKFITCNVLLYRAHASSGSVPPLIALLSSIALISSSMSLIQGTALVRPWVSETQDVFGVKWVKKSLWPSNHSLKSQQTHFVA